MIEEVRASVCVVNDEGDVYCLWRPYVLVLLLFSIYSKLCVLELISVCDSNLVVQRLLIDDGKRLKANSVTIKETPFRVVLLHY